MTSYLGINIVCKPTEASTILLDFIRILEKVRGQAQTCNHKHLFSRNVQIVHPYIDNQYFYNNLNFLGVVNVFGNWYSPCIRLSGWLKVLPKNMYV